jgi:hypothetical protein
VSFKTTVRRRLPGACRECGQPSRRARCARCNPTKATQEHRDKYAATRPVAAGMDPAGSVAEILGEATR